MVQQRCSLSKGTRTKSERRITMPLGFATSNGWFSRPFSPELAGWHFNVVNVGNGLPDDGLAVDLPHLGRCEGRGYGDENPLNLAPDAASG